MTDVAGVARSECCYGQNIYRLLEDEWDDCTQSDSPEGRPKLNMLKGRFDRMMMA